MTRFVALLRGINVGKAKRVAMGDLRELLASLGYEDVRTLLNSGNAVFRAPARSPSAHAKRIRSTMAATLGVDAPVIVVPAAEFSSIAAANPLRAIASDPSRLLVAFVDDTYALASLRDLATASWAPEALAVGRHAAYLWCPGGILASRVAEAVAGRLGERVTTRNDATVGKLDALLRSPGD